MTINKGKIWTDRELRAIVRAAQDISYRTTTGDAVAALYELTSRRHAINATVDPDVREGFRTTENFERTAIHGALVSGNAEADLIKLVAMRFGLDR